MRAFLESSPALLVGSARLTTWRRALPWAPDRRGGDGVWDVQVRPPQGRPRPQRRPQPVELARRPPHHQRLLRRHRRPGRRLRRRRLREVSAAPDSSGFVESFCAARHFLPARLMHDLSNGISPPTFRTTLALTLVVLSYEVDMTAAFGTCKCGKPKAAHSSVRSFECGNVHVCVGGNMCASVGGIHRLRVCPHGSTYIGAPSAAALRSGTKAPRRSAQARAGATSGGARDESVAQSGDGLEANMLMCLPVANC